MTADNLPPSVRIAYPEDCVRISQTCGACVCMLVKKDCEYCKTIWPVWAEFCETFKIENVLVVHCECSQLSDRAKSLMAASTYPQTHTSFPAVLVCRDSDVITLDIDSSCGIREMNLKVMETLLTDEIAEGAAEGTDEYTPLQDLTMEEVDFAEDDANSNEQADGVTLPPDDDDYWAATAQSVDESLTETEDGVLVTHQVTPEEALDMASDASANHRVAILYFTNWCGHCKHFKPTWNKCVRQSRSNSHETRAGRDHAIAWLAVNCESDAGQAAASAQRVRGYPTIHLHHSYREPFEGERNVEGLLKFAHRDTITPALLRIRH